MFNIISKKTAFTIAGILIVVTFFIQKSLYPYAFANKEPTLVAEHKFKETCLLKTFNISDSKILYLGPTNQIDCNAKDLYLNPTSSVEGPYNLAFEVFDTKNNEVEILYEHPVALHSNFQAVHLPDNKVLIVGQDYHNNAVVSFVYQYDKNEIYDIESPFINLSQFSVVELEEESVYFIVDALGNRVAEEGFSFIKFDFKNEKFEHVTDVNTKDNKLPSFNFFNGQSRITLPLFRASQNREINLNEFFNNKRDSNPLLWPAKNTLLSDASPWLISMPYMVPRYIFKEIDFIPIYDFYLMTYTDKFNEENINYYERIDYLTPRLIQHSSDYFVNDEIDLPCFIKNYGRYNQHQYTFERSEKSENLFYLGGDFYCVNGWHPFSGKSKELWMLQEKFSQLNAYERNAVNTFMLMEIDVKAKKNKIILNSEKIKMDSLNILNNSIAILTDRSSIYRIDF